MIPHTRASDHVPFRIRTTLATLAALLLASASAQEPSAAERSALLKARAAASQAALHQYEWIQTTVVSLGGDEKSRKQERCYYGADGGLQKVEVGATPEAAPRRGLRGRIAERKKEELTDYMKSAVALVRTYVPPNADRIQRAKEAGKVSIEMLDPGKRIRLSFRDYEKAGDNLGVEVDLTNNRPLALKASSYLDDPEDKVTLEVRMAQLNEGTDYPAEVTLNAPAKKLTVNVQNSGYRKTN